MPKTGLVSRKSLFAKRAYALIVIGIILIVALGIVVALYSRATGAVYRAFEPNGYWNTPMPADAPIDPNSAAWIADAQKSSQNYLNLVLTNSYGEPIYFSSATDPVYNLPADGGGTVAVHIPIGAKPATGSDAEMIVLDRTTGYNRAVGLWKAAFSNGTWTVSGADHYQLDSNGLDRRVGGDNPQNYGHRGVPAPVRAVRLDEIQAGAINHRLECYWWATADAHYFPMAANETGKGGIVPEGVVIRVKPSVNLAALSLSPAARVVATAMQQYGCVVGDNSGSGNNLKGQAGVNWSGILAADSLKSLPWSDWEFIKGGYNPPAPTSSATPTPTPSPSPSPTSNPVGDINGDGKVNAVDLSALLSAWGTSNAQADLNHDGTVNLVDLSIVLSHWTG